MPDPASILSTNKLTMRFGGLIAVGDLDLEVRERAIHSIIGPNGAGKTTVFNCIMQNIQIQAPGRSGFAGERIDGLTPDRVAAVGHQPHLSEHPAVPQHHRDREPAGRHASASALALVGRAASIRRTPGATRPLAHEEAMKLLQFVGLRGRGDVLARNLAYGEQRRLEIGRALATKPKLLMLDEPTAGMNPRETSEMMDFIRRVRDEFGITILLIEHQMRVVMGMSDVVTVLDHGVKIAEGHARRGAERPEGDRGLSRHAASGAATARQRQVSIRRIVSDARTVRAPHGHGHNRIARHNGASRNRRHPRLLRQHRGAEGRLARRRGEADRDACRRERRRQDHDACGRSAASFIRAPARSASTARASATSPPHEIAIDGRDAGAGGPAHLRSPDGRGKPADGGLRAPRPSRRRRGQGAHARRSFRACASD